MVYAGGFHAIGEVLSRRALSRFTSGLPKITGQSFPICRQSTNWVGLGTASVREALESLPQDEHVAYTTVQTLVYGLEEKGALKK